MLGIIIRMEEAQIKAFIIGSSLAVAGIPSLLMNILFKDVGQKHIFMIISLICGIANAVLVNHILNEHHDPTITPTYKEKYIILGIFGLILGAIFSVIFGSIYESENQKYINIILWSITFSLIFTVVIDYLNNRLFELY